MFRAGARARRLGLRTRCGSFTRAHGAPLQRHCELRHVSRRQLSWNYANSKTAQSGKLEGLHWCPQLRGHGTHQRSGFLLLEWAECTTRTATAQEIFADRPQARGAGSPIVTVAAITSGTSSTVDGCRCRYDRAARVSAQLSPFGRGPDPIRLVRPNERFPLSAIMAGRLHVKARLPSPFCRARGSHVPEGPSTLQAERRVLC